VPGKPRTARTDVADFMLNQLTDDRYRHKAVAIASDL
jgi:hypothetical protein